MGEVVVSGEGGLELRGHQTEAQKERALPASQGNEIKAEDGVDGTYCSSSSVAVRERFLQKIAVRVLLVETDDSTRQIIAALLRKCNYRVAAVPDGLKAWEVLKGRSHNIDLILTEVELPSISGYALLTLIMEHDICKNIPVIMMSSHDPVSTVYKCMLRGAADFLVKPIRKNELRNLWQHVWRKQSRSRSVVGLGPHPYGRVALQMVEATAENYAISNHSSGHVECIQRNRELEKGSDTQSSCTKPELEAEEHNVEPKDNVVITEEEERHQEIRKTQVHDNDAGTVPFMPCTDVNNATTQGEGHNMNPNDGCEQVKVIDQISKCHHLTKKSSTEGIYLLGAFDNYPKGASGTAVSNASSKKVDIIPLPLLDLSLKRSHPRGSVNQVQDEKCRLNHSDASAFSWYVNKPLQPRNSLSPSSCNRHKDHVMNSGKQQSNHIPDYNSDARAPSMTTIPSGQPAAATLPYHHQQETCQPVPYRGANVINGIGSPTPQICCTPLPKPSHFYDFSQLNPCYSLDCLPIGSCQFINVLSQTISHTVDRIDCISHGQKLENLEDPEIALCANDQRANGSLYNAHISYHNSTGSVSNGKISSISIVKSVSESGKEKGQQVVHEGRASHRSLQREVALTKFRLKRKDRCFEKKVRYESRKKLAEQRPRMKGQFVRQVPNGPQPGSSLAG